MSRNFISHLRRKSKVKLNKLPWLRITNAEENLVFFIDLLRPKQEYYGKISVEVFKIDVLQWNCWVDEWSSSPILRKWFLKNDFRNHFLSIELEDHSSTLIYPSSHVSQTWNWWVYKNQSYKKILKIAWAGTLTLLYLTRYNETRRTIRVTRQDSDQRCLVET